MVQNSFHIGVMNMEETQTGPSLSVLTMIVNMNLNRFGVLVVSSWGNVSPESEDDDGNDDEGQENNKPWGSFIKMYLVLTH